MNRYFITGTDTDCGKTYVTRMLLDLVPMSCGIKPVASGCTWVDGQLVNNDSLLLSQGKYFKPDLINPWRFTPAIAPHIAAAQESRRLTVEDIAEFCLNFNMPQTDTLFIEGAGGLMVPLNEHETWLDLLKLTQIPVILVVGMKLGCINHALLTDKVMCAYGISCKGWIANCIDPDMQVLDENILCLTQLLKVPFLGVVPNQGSLSTFNIP